MKKLLTLLLLSPLVFAETKETALDCKWERTVSYDNPDMKIESDKDESVVIKESVESKDLVFIQMYGYGYKADRKVNKILWDVPDARFETWEYRHVLDTVTGNLNVTLHQPLSDDASWELDLRRESDNTIKSFTAFYKCSKVTPLFD